MPDWARGGWDELYGLGRSLAIYYLKPGRARRMRRMYGRFVGPGALCFDVGAHVGNRSRCFRKLGASVVAVEPQPRFASFLRWLFRSDRAVDILPIALAARPGTVPLMISRATPTVSTGSAPFVAAVSGVDSFAAVRWGQPIEVAASTLDRLIERFGLPAFVKIDVEGMEDEVLAGLSHAVPALSLSSCRPIAPRPCGRSSDFANWEPIGSTSRAARACVTSSRTGEALPTSRGGSATCRTRRPPATSMPGWTGADDRGDDGRARGHLRRVRQAGSRRAQGCGASGLQPRRPHRHDQRALSFVTGQENLVHMHRLRALADAVLVGAGTVAH